MIHLVTALIALYVICRYIWPMPWHKTIKKLAAIILLLTAEHHLITRNFFGSMASPEIPAAVIIGLGWAFGTLLLIALLQIIKDLSGTFIYIFSRTAAQKWFTQHLFKYSIGIVAALLAAVGVKEAIRVPDVKTIEITLERLPKEFDGFRLVQLTDLHASRLLQAPWIQAVVDKTNALQPDMIVLTGDMIDGTPEARAKDVLPLQQLQAPQGVFAIPGNHEYYIEYLRWLPVFEQLGLALLLNEHRIIQYKGAELILAGITDRTASSFGQLQPDLSAALTNAPKETTTILLSHRPTSALNHAKQGIDLQLSGHTHGGQILGPHLLTKWANEGLVSGKYTLETMQLYVSNGTGLWNGLPIRLGRPSEITEIILRAHP